MGQRAGSVEREHGTGAFAVTLIGARFGLGHPVHVTEVVTNSARMARSINTFLNAMEAAFTASMVFIGPVASWSISCFEMVGNATGR